MAERVISFTDQDQQEIEGIVVDKDGAAALNYLAALMDRVKVHYGHACGPKAAEGPPGHG